MGVAVDMAVAGWADPPPDQVEHVYVLTVGTQ